ncbi:MAG: WD40/YVTN/BNR-like repeat-containing protein [Thermaurantiacus sp.]
MMNLGRLTSLTAIFFAAGMLLVTTPAAHAESGKPLIELLKSTHIHGIAVDRADTGRLLIATHHGLHALRLDTGTVEPVSEQRDDFMGFTPHPVDAATLYGSGHPAGGGNLGFVASADGGRTWTMLSAGIGGPVDFHQMDVSKADPSVIYGVHDGLQVSRDGGRSWSRVGPAPDGLIDISASATDAARLYAATRQGLLVSEEHGRDWRPAHLLRRPVSMIEVASDGTMYAFMVGSGLLRAEERSLNWTTLSNDFGDSYVLHFAIDPADPARQFAATHQNELLASDDGGRTWRGLGAP